MSENTLKCHTCGREWPIETSSPHPGTWDFSSGKLPGGGGLWTRDYLEIGSDGEAKFSEWYFIGPCCELRHSDPDYDDETEEHLEEFYRLELEDEEDEP